MKYLSYLFLLVLTLTSFGCSDDSAPVEMVLLPDAGRPTGCGTMPACAAGDICRNGMCVPNVQTCDPACPVGQTCDRETLTCRTEEDGACTDNSECAVGFCVGGRCQDVDCVEDNNCKQDEYCEDNRCLPAVTACADGDGDGYGVGPDCLGIDCDDTRADVNPGVRENGQLLCDDDIDHDCDGTPAVCGDTDGDNDGVTVRAGDCDDRDPEVNPEQPELPYNGKDDDCDPSTSDTDIDSDGFPGNADGTGEDCDDTNPNIFPGADDIPGDMVDQDCDGMDREPQAGDLDMDGFSEQDGDCNDNDDTINPGVMEVPYNGKDDDCDLETLDNDLDMDGFFFPEDCDDNNRAINPDIEEIYYNGLNDDCDDTTVDDDADGDGFTFGENGTDCNDQSAAVNPQAMEVPYNGEDDDCNPDTKDDDLDNDGFLNEDDCNDDDPNVNPDVVENAEINCGDMIDNDCRGGDVECDMGAMDTDMDGIPDDQDCEPMNAEIPGPIEIVNNGLDDDCNPETLDACEDDIFDIEAPNDSFMEATPVSDGNTRAAQYGGLEYCTNDRDWYKIDVPQGSGLEVDLFFEHTGNETDLDIRLYRMEGEELNFIDSGFTVNDNETVYLRRADADATYYIEVFSFFTNARVSYSMSVNVFNDCVDDFEGFTRGEHNDTLDEASDLPEGREVMQICDFDDDYYSFVLETEQTVRFDLIFKDADGDLDMALFDSEGDRIVSSMSGSDNEVIERELQPGRYTLRVYGFTDAQNSYRLFRTSGVTNTITYQLDGDGLAIPDYSDGMPGTLSVDVPIAAPAGSLIRLLTIRLMDLDHDYLTDLRLTGQWNGLDVVSLWNRLGASNGADGGFDDDFSDLIGGRDIVFRDRAYQEFSGLPADGVFTLFIEDLIALDTGTLQELEIEVEYLVP